MGLRKSVIGVLSACLLMAGILSPPVEAQTDPPPPPSDEPVEVLDAVDDVEMVSKNGTTTIDVTGNDTDDSDDADVVITIQTQPTSGTVSIDVDEDLPVVEYTPDSGAPATDSFTYEACVDGSCDAATVTIFIGMSGCTIKGTNGADTLTGTEGDDVICGRKGHDIINGLGGNDIIFGGKGRDTIDGGDGDDVIRGQRGKDTIRRASY